MIPGQGGFEQTSEGQHHHHKTRSQLKSYNALDVDQSFNEDDAKYLEEVILRVKDECETAIPTSDYIEAVLKELDI